MKLDPIFTLLRAASQVVLTSPTLSGESARGQALSDLADDLPDAVKALDDIKVAFPVLDELERSQSLHPHWPSDPLHAVAILAEELGELTQKLLQATYEPKKLVTVESIKEEAVQVAAMGLRFLVNFERYQFPTPSGITHE